MNAPPQLDCTFQVACISFVQVLTLECRRYWFYIFCQRYIFLFDLALVGGGGGWTALLIFVFGTHMLYTS